MKHLLVVVLVCLGFLGCSSQSNTPAPAEKPLPKAPEVIAGAPLFS